MFEGGTTRLSIEFVRCRRRHRTYTRAFPTLYHPRNTRAALTVALAKYMGGTTTVMTRKGSECEGFVLEGLMPNV